MENKKTVTINSKYIIAFVVSFLISFLSVYLLSYLGTFDYAPLEFSIDKGSIEKTDTNPISYVTFKSVFNTEVTVRFPYDYKVKDIRYSDGKFFQFENLCKYYNSAFKHDYIYAIYIAIILFLLYLFFTKIKFRIAS